MRVTRLGDEQDRPDDGETGEHDVQGEERVPGKELQQQAGAEEPDDRPTAGDAHPDADRAAALLFREGGGDDGQGDGHDGGGADAHDGAEGDQGVRALDEDRRGRRAAEDGQPGQQDALAAEPVADRASRQQEPGEHDRVGIDDPLQLALGRAGVPCETWQRDVEAADGGDHHHQGEGHHTEDDLTLPDRQDFLVAHRVVPPVNSTCVEFRMCRILWVRNSPVKTHASEESP
ncbi:MAG: hypothetical protein AVDCRST_MAG33-3353 [uncultured Thermomicrobiales bacterium]|uniref:Uncharacterized protein n=1 Tax=uncultured Thermomicrobiales bacterium TaxID=1645740 RepID=A0A6J4VI82_9BACT|nr:MAG: hypothetical protein AVDCRST_MAG33-3353 [uncultured Thermomicrobiales bacterium]